MASLVPAGTLVIAAPGNASTGNRGPYSPTTRPLQALLIRHTSPSSDIGAHPCSLGVTTSMLGSFGARPR